MSNNKTVLVIDDDVDIANSTKDILVAKGFNAITANSSDEGIEAFNNNKVDIVLLDMIMESVDSGLKVCREIRVKNKDVKIFLLSDVGDGAKDNLNIFDYGFNGAMQKPVKMDELLNLVD
jgi:DNA-binding response OmpR family regulator